MWPRRRDEPLHRRLAREAGLGEEPAPHDPGPHWGEVGIHGIHRPREWDAVVTVGAAVAGDEVRFVALAESSLLVEEGAEDVDPSELADAVERVVAPPYRAVGVRRGGLWIVGARRIEVVSLEEDPGGDELELAWDGEARSLLVGGTPRFGGVPELERLASERYDAWAVRAARLDGALWEVEVAPL